jgi:formylglycine-generating enzyme required for sulfatase activity
MADVFISYKREERAAVERLARELRALGLSVWFDASLSAGETFSDEIDREARAARAILVCWSPAARGSDWVKAEALIGFTNKTLAACYVAGPDGFDPPAPFNGTHAEDLRAWLAAPSAAHAGWKSLLRRIGRLCAREDVESYGALDVQAPALALRAWLSRHEASPLFMTVDALLQTRDAEDAERARLEQEARTRRAQEEAERARQEAERQAAEALRQAEARAKAEWEAAQAAQEEAARLAQEQQEAAAAEAAREEAARLMQLHRQEALGQGLRTWAILAGAAGLALVALLLWAPWRASPPTLAAGQSFRDCADCPEMVVIPAGSFSMGSLDGEVGRETNEGPQRRVTITQPFAAGKFEVTFDEYDTCVAAKGCAQRPYDSGWGRGRRPVINVSWEDTQEYVRWLSQKTGQRYRLLSEAEWEYAARSKANGGAKEPAYSWGPSPSHDYANYGADVCCSGLASGRDQWVNTAPVGSFPANAFGLHDMHGNVWEWVEDCYGDSYSGTPTKGAAVTTQRCGFHVLRGGSWNDSPQYLRSANRDGSTPTVEDVNGGFRLARTL